MVYFKKKFFPNPPKLREVKINGKRHYESPKGNLLPSVTTVLSLLSDEGIESWRKRVGEKKADEIMVRSGTNGTNMHSMIELFLDNKATESIKNDTSRKLFEQMKPELLKINNIIAQEVQLYSENLGVAGRVDCVGEYNGVLSVIDFKSARAKKKKDWILKYFLQATCYAVMFEELVSNTTKEKIDQIVILISSEDGVVEAYVENKNDYIEHLYAVIEDYKLRKKYEPT